MNIVSGLASTEIIERELIHLFREVPKWTIKQMDSDVKYLIKFPNEEIRYQVAKFKSFEFETANVKAKVTPTDMAIDVEEKLKIVWVKAHKFPPFARKEDIVMEIAYLVADPIEADLTTLSREEPIRIKLSCRESHKIGGETNVFFNGEGYNIRWEVERSQQESGKATSKFDRRKGSDDENKEKEEEGEFHGKDNFGSGKQKDGGETRPSYLDQNKRGEDGSAYRKRGEQRNLNKNLANTVGEGTQKEVQDHGSTQMDAELNQDTQESRVAGLGGEEGEI
jgi:hypothetical protein